MTKPLNKDYWEGRYIENNAKWSVGAITTPLKEYIDQLPNKDIKILVPGLGHGHELLYLHRLGFTNIVGLDLTDIAMRETCDAVSDFPKDKVVLGDFFEHNGQYDLIIEQTFFCSLPKTLRKKYVDKMYDLLLPGGKLVGVLFDCEFKNDEPPFGGSKEEYTTLLSEKLNINLIETAYNSIKPRAGRELFFITIKQHD
ncbi:MULTISPECIES: methyltransferase domain-containing protein [unclassified Myroides]|uniref:methyltransferase domain-containing protein n=1 Tax=unclassified Myroides TaxID=2642485 RepID=UPI0031010437